MYTISVSQDRCEVFGIANRGGLWIRQNVFNDYDLSFEDLKSICENSIEDLPRQGHNDIAFISEAIKLLATADEDCYVVHDFLDPDPDTPFIEMEDGWEGAGEYAAVDGTKVEFGLSIYTACRFGHGKVVMVDVPRHVLKKAYRAAGKPEAPGIKYEYEN